MQQKGCYYRMGLYSESILCGKLVSFCRRAHDRIISTGLWPPRSADLTYCDYYLWGYLKGKVYRNNPHTLEELKAQITRAVQCITEAELQKVSNNLFKRCEACLTADGGHFQQYLK